VHTSENKTHPINLPHQQLQPNKPQKPTQNTPTTQKTTKKTSRTQNTHNNNQTKNRHKFKLRKPQMINSTTPTTINYKKTRDWEERYV
jgi:hypothetical protein